MSIEVLPFSYESASCTVTLWGDGAASVSDVYSAIKRKGHAKTLMKNVVAFADSNKLLLKTAAEAYGEGGMTTEQLTEFYKTFGFVVLGDDPSYLYMERPFLDTDL